MAWLSFLLRLNSSLLLASLCPVLMWCSSQWHPKIRIRNKQTELPNPKKYLNTVKNCTSDYGIYTLRKNSNAMSEYHKAMLLLLFVVSILYCIYYTYLFIIVLRLLHYICSHTHTFDTSVHTVFIYPNTVHTSP